MSALWQFEHSVECDGGRAFWRAFAIWDQIEGKVVDSKRLEELAKLTSVITVASFDNSLDD